MNEDIGEENRNIYADKITKEYAQIEKILFQIQNNEFDPLKNKLKCTFNPFQSYLLVKKLAKKGIPSLMRGFIWYELLNAEKYKQSSKMNYTEILTESEKYYESIAPFELIIKRDISRTFPKHMLFREKLGWGQKSLYRILRAYSIYNQNIGYCQGMGFISAFLLNFYDEENCFWMLAALIEKFQLAGFLTSNMPSLPKAFYIYMSLMRKFLPRLYETFLMFKVHPSMYASQWFITLFAVNLPLDVLGRVWDLFILQGMKIIYKIGLTLLKMNEEILLTLNFEEIIEKIKVIYAETDKDSLIKNANSFKITNKLIEAFEKEFEENPVKEIKNKWCY